MFNVKRTLKSALRHLGYELRTIQAPNRYALFDDSEPRDHEILKAFTLRTAQFSPQQAKIVRNLCLAGFHNTQPQTAYTRIEVGDDATLRLGVWSRQRRGKDVPFVRDPQQRHEWFYWAERERLEPKRTRWRVVLTGESVARGYFYDPQFNLASALQGLLESELGPAQIDVVDLAKSNLRMPQLKDCIGQCLALTPDVVVVFAGNNWHPHLSDSDIPYVDSLLRQAGVPGLKAYLDGKREQASRRLVNQANSVLAPRNVKIVWVIPETNLRDWVDPRSVAPLLPENGNSRWLACDRQMSQALDRRDYPHAARLAEEMLELDGGTSAIPLRCLAECASISGDMEAARRYLQLCRDAVGWDPSFSHCPRVFSPIQQALREGAKQHSNAVVDLTELFAHHLEGALPDRRLFLDYCHMTAEGIRLTAAEIAAHVLFLTANVRDARVTAGKLASRVQAVPAKVEGKACLLAAAHNAAYYQDVRLVKYWCDRALEFWPECAQLMRRFADVATRDLPVALCRSGLELPQFDELNARPYFFHGRQRRLDLSFGDAAVASLADVGIAISQEIADLRLREHSTRNGPKDLVDFFYSAPIPTLSERGWTSRALTTNHGSHAIFASAFWEKTLYVFLAERGQDIAITFTYRVRLCAPGASVVVDVNGRRIAELPAERTWCTHRISIPNDCILNGVNEILISWPAEDQPSDMLLAEAADCLLAKRLPCLHRVFGEIHSLSIADQPMTTGPSQLESPTDRVPS